MNNTGDKSGNSVAELENVENNFGYGVRNDSLNNVKINFKRQISDNAIDEGSVVNDDTIDPSTMPVSKSSIIDDILVEDNANDAETNSIDSCDLFQLFVNEMAVEAKIRRESYKLIKLFSVKYLDMWCKKRNVYVDEDGIPILDKNLINSIEKSKRIRKRMSISENNSISTDDRTDFDETRATTNDCKLLSSSITPHRVKRPTAETDLFDETPKRRRIMTVTNADDSEKTEIISRKTISAKRKSFELIDKRNSTSTSEPKTRRRISAVNDSKQKKLIKTPKTTKLKSFERKCVVNKQNSNLKITETAEPTTEHEDNSDVDYDSDHSNVGKDETRKTLQGDEIEEYMKLLSRLLSKRTTQRDKVEWYITEKNKIPYQPNEYISQQDIDDAKKGLQIIWTAWTKYDYQNRMDKLRNEWDRIKLLPKPLPRRHWIYNADEDRHFLQSLLCVPLKCGPQFTPDVSVQKYIACFDDHKEELVDKLFDVFNKTICNNALPRPNIIWVDHLDGMMGCTTIIKDGVKRFSRIRLCKFHVNDPHQLIITLFHELCHSAAWQLKGRTDIKFHGHGDAWKYWIQRIRKRLPFLPAIREYGDGVYFKAYKYRCLRCAYVFNTNISSVGNLCHRCHGLLIKIKNKFNRNYFNKAFASYNKIATTTKAALNHPINIETP